MDAENDNDQPNSSSASASVTPSSSNNSSSSNLLGNLPMLPFMRSTDDDDVHDGVDDDDDIARNVSDEMHEEPVPMQVANDETAGVNIAQAAMPVAPNMAADNAVMMEPVVRVVDPLAVVPNRTSSSTTSPTASLPSSVALLANRSFATSFANSSSSVVNNRTPQVLVTPFLFNIPLTNANDTNQLPQLQLVQEVEPQQQNLLMLNTLPNPVVPTSPLVSSQLLDNSSHQQSLQALATTSISPLSSASSSTASSSSSPSSSSHQSSYNLAQYQQQQQQLQPNPNPYPSLVSSSFPSQQQEQHHQASPPPSSNIATSSSTPPREQQLPQQQEQINRNDIADTIDASAVVVQPLEANAVNQQADASERNQAAAPSAVEAYENDIQLDDNDNNDFDVDLNARNDSLANAASTSAAAQRHQSPQAQQQDETLPSLDTSASGSAGTSGGQLQQQTTQPPPTTLPLLLYQQPPPQQLQTGESKHSPPSYDHHYHNPRDFHHHHHHHHQQHSSNFYQQHHSCGYPFDFAASLQQQQKNTNGAGCSSNTSSTMFGNSSSAERNGSSGDGIGAGNANTEPVVDRLKMLYPNVNENETPLPRCWSPHDKCLSIGLSQNNMRVHFKGVGKQNNDAASVRTAHPIPPACGIYYFEVKIISKGKSGYMGIGLTAQQFRMNRLPGWDKQSYGYHGDDGNSFSSSGNGQSYGPTFTTGDIIGCCVNFVNNTCFYTKNGTHLGIAFRDLPTKLYPTVGLQTPGEEVDVNFGQEPFKFDRIEEMMRDMRDEMKKTIYEFPLLPDQGDPTTLLQKMVNSYLVHNGYSETADAFARTTGQSLREDISSIRNRQKILKLVMSGRMGQAIEQTLRLYPGLLENNKNLWFMLKCRQFIEMINGSDIENGNTSDAATAAAAANSSAVVNIASVSVAAPTSTNNNSSNSSSNNVNTSSSSSSNGSANTTTTTTDNNNTNPSAAAIAVASTTPATTNNSSNIGSNNALESSTANNAQNSSHITVINTDNDIKTESNLVEHCSASGDAPTTISKNNTDNDYLNDVEMENNGHATNGNICKNGNTNNFNDSIDADEEMDVDVSPSVRKYSHGIERILEFGKDLSQMGQQLEKENKMTDEERQMLEDAFSLIAYSNPWASPLGWQLCPTKRETICRALNSAILESKFYAKWPPLEYCVAHANELLKVMAQASLGACAFVNISDVFPKN